ncbi:Ribose 1,5-bisphosphate phosphokinase PhnN [Devosia sp. LC5]|uniref:phosphonate metabolism protein/1,5-bisphosphokinase (PRPP-forming) PhnN n=1 Tax=Devosia sp. LC5 TaxID=1502724 RepID=UPI0004E3F798|nr:phosphonate metabolism protein/1,5-bisphosphokinase (PRPP-forming) PhnN [Devosia sp. LC5]KFC67398.1 Ribose 1,5-bisphosphate phosphokinase PhnN [Devosia sp. LC5]
MSSDASASGAFVAVVGPSGSGKDSLIDFARQRLAGRAEFTFVRRIVTRPADRAAEDHDSLSEAHFEALAQSNGLALHWQAHGLRYGLPRSIDSDIEAGRVVIANVSRQVIGEAAARYRRVIVANISARPEIIAQRLAARGREDAEAIRQRLARQLDVAVPGGESVEIDNSGPLQEAGEHFLGLLQQAQAERV